MKLIYDRRRKFLKSDSEKKQLAEIDEVYSAPRHVLPKFGFAVNRTIFALAAQNLFKT